MVGHLEMVPCRQQHCEQYRFRVDMIFLAEQHSSPVYRGTYRQGQNLRDIFAGEPGPEQTRQGKHLLRMSNSVLICLTSFMLYAPVGRWCLWVASLTNRDPHSAPSPVLTAKQSQRTGLVSISCHSNTRTLPCYRAVTDGRPQVPRRTSDSTHLHAHRHTHLLLGSYCIVIRTCVLLQ